MPQVDNISDEHKATTNPSFGPQSHSEITDLIGNPPSWLLTSGITMVAIVTIIILGGSYLFKYPDKLAGIGILTSNTPPIEIVSRTTGYIDKIHFSQDSEVEKGDAILYISNTTDQNQLNQLRKWIEQYEMIQNPRDFLSLPWVENLQLGLVQSEYANLQLRFNELQQLLRNRMVFKQVNNLSREIEKIKILNISQEKEKSIYAQELELSKKDFERNEKLKSDGTISALDLERAKTALLQKERQFEGMNNTLIQNNIRIEQLELEKLKLQQQRSKTIQDYQFRISEILARIRSAIENWNKTYTVNAPISGKIVYNKDIVVQKNLKLSQSIGYIIPIENQDNYISTTLPDANIGKVERGQKAIVKFDAFPYKEYGIVIGKVEEINKLPEIDASGNYFYDIKIPLEETIKTDYDKEIPYKPNMKAQVEIIVKERSIFERLFDQFLRLINDI